MNRVEGVFLEVIKIGKADYSDLSNNNPIKQIHKRQEPKISFSTILRSISIQREVSNEPTMHWMSL
ncbi:hypothetical protein [Bacillus sp. 2205SS5-2]|uniref:hypothetical protein n=1 Tax=Bacillus sp. 2205SS5-2 TaxID=3109031 RepID=UPI00300401DF